MKTILAPNYVHHTHDVVILWFQVSNKYLVLNDHIYTLLDCFLQSKDYSHFHQLINTGEPISGEVSGVLFSEIESLLTSVHSIDPEENKVSEVSVLDSEFPFISIFYNFNGVIIQVCYQSENEQRLIHPQFSYLEIEAPQINADCVFHISSSNHLLHLFKSNHFLESYSTQAYHLLQGKFAIELLCTLTQTKESDWLASFHASTISNNSEAVMLIGESGKGKSTLSAILMDYGFNLLTDDLSPMLAKTQQIHHFPSAISIKKNAFSLIDSLSERIKYRTFQSPNSHKGLLKYVTPVNSDIKPLPCSKIVLVNYEADSEASLDTLPIEEALNALIPDSWISPHPEHVRIFMDWLDSCSFYKLTYSETDAVISKFETLLRPAQ
ncbi:hypothetical protein OS188_12895 [Xanthomarina sp. F1114]|uniref:hypothetical protein n=1 Tax=Xanthomarina sp. F1114 TaxID=2996019 RepID=UPI00225E17CF|nr:hypothetical protein [Xanthomarina sp. F1114]MCX7548850.1 hypothetical protein [Xanthomarina sp. F1114]